MSDDRVASIEREVTDLRVSNATLSASIEHLVKAVDSLTLVVQQQRDTMNQGRGILITLMFVSGAVGALVATFVRKVMAG